MMETEQIFMRIREAAPKSGVGESYLRKLVREGKCPGFRIDPDNPRSKFMVDYQGLIQMLREIGQQGQVG